MEISDSSKRIKVDGFTTTSLSKTNIDVKPFKSGLVSGIPLNSFLFLYLPSAKNELASAGDRTTQRSEEQVLTLTQLNYHLAECAAKGESTEALNWRPYGVCTAPPRESKKHQTQKIEVTVRGKCCINNIWDFGPDTYDYCSIEARCKKVNVGETETFVTDNGNPQRVTYMCAGVYLHFVVSWNSKRGWDKESHEKFWKEDHTSLVFGVGMCMENPDYMQNPDKKVDNNSEKAVLARRGITIELFMH